MVCVGLAALAGPTSLAACGGGGEPDASPSRTTEAPATTDVSETTGEATGGTDPAAVTAVLASRLRGEFPGVQDTHLNVDGGELLLRFVVGEGETPGDARAFATLAVGELRTFSPATLDGVTEVDVRIEGATTPTHERFPLFGDLLPTT